jgi:1,2-diacylglycerol-3-alpha-glucose alpha-1,2-galactosyltransferase
MMMKKIRVNMVSESDITVQGHGVHTAYDEMASALEQRSDVTLIRGDFGKQTDCDVVHLHTIGPRTWRKLLQRGPAKVVSAHIVPASLVGSIILADYWLPLAARYMKWFYGKADKVLAVSGSVAKVLHEDLGIPKEKIETFYNTVDMQRYVATPAEKKAARTALGLSADDFIVLGIGQVQPRKRAEIFIAMAKALPDVQFVWIGGIPFKRLGADYAAMQQLMDSAPPNLRMTGVIPHQQVRDYIIASDVFCLPAEQENHPMCVLEAAGAGVPIVLRDIPEYDDTFKGDAIMCGDDDFAAAIVKLRGDKAFYKKQQQHTKRIAERFDSSNGAERLVKLYRQLV